MIEANIKIVFERINNVKITPAMAKDPQLIKATETRMKFLQKELEKGFKKTNIKSKVTFDIKPLENG